MARMKKATCNVRYQREHCSPFCAGIDGARCVRDAGHPGDHTARIAEWESARGPNDVRELRFRVLDTESPPDLDAAPVPP
jgi:hypothetical protein